MCIQKNSSRERQNLRIDFQITIFRMISKALPISILAEDLNHLKMLAQGLNPQIPLQDSTNLAIPQA
jgi:hypothetical protein